MPFNTDTFRHLYVTAISPSLVKCAHLSSDGLRHGPRLCHTWISATQPTVSSGLRCTQYCVGHLSHRTSSRVTGCLAATSSAALTSKCAHIQSPVSSSCQRVLRWSVQIPSNSPGPLDSQLYVAL